MTLTPGTRLGSFEIVGSLGAGGMGEVYRARDTKLNRDVAIKVLPETFAFDRERVARFEREAQAQASVSPNVNGLPSRLSGKCRNSASATSGSSRPRAQRSARNLRVG